MHSVISKPVLVLAQNKQDQMYIRPYKANIAIQCHNVPQKHAYCSLAQFLFDLDIFSLMFQHQEKEQQQEQPKLLIGPLRVARGKKIQQKKRTPVYAYIFFISFDFSLAILFSILDCSVSFVFLLFFSILSTISIPKILYLLILSPLLAPLLFHDIGIRLCRKKPQ